jgi:hypothetical protein
VGQSYATSSDWLDEHRTLGGSVVSLIAAMMVARRLFNDRLAAATWDAT